MEKLSKCERDRIRKSKEKGHFQVPMINPVIHKDGQWGVVVRVSTDGQFQDGESYENQIKASNDLVEKHKGKVYKEYKEDGVSAFKKRVHQRPVMMELLNDIASGKVKFIVAFKRDRICRDPMDYYILREAFSKAGVKVFLTCGTETWGDPDTNSPTDELLDGLMPLLAKFESMTTSQRVRANLQAIVQRGEWRNSRPPYGYKYDSTTKKVLQVPHQTETCRLIRDLYKQGYGGRKIADMLNNKYKIPYESTAPEWKSGVHQKRDKWYSEVVISIVSKPVYCGIQVWGGEWYECNDIDAIFTKEEWMETYQMYQAKLNKAVPHKYYNTVFLFKDVIFCAHCGEKMLPKYHKRNYDKADGTVSIYEYYEYRCEGRWDKSNGCRSRVHRRAFIEDAIIQLVGEQIKDYNIDDLYKDLLGKLKQESKEYNLALSGMNTEIKQLQKSADQFADSFLEAPPNSSMRKRLLEKSEEVERALEQKQKELESLLSNPPEEHVNQSEVAKTYESMKRWIGVMNNPEVGREVKRKLALEVIESIEVDKESNLDIKLKVSKSYPNSQAQKKDVLEQNRKQKRAG